MPSSNTFWKSSPWVLVLVTLLLAGVVLGVRLLLGT